MALHDQKLITPVILSGGEGTRLWPLSRALFPKQLQPIASDSSLLQEAIVRLSGEDFAPPIIVCNEEHRFIVAQQARGVGCTNARIVLEPVGRNTAPAAALAALIAAENDPDALLLIAPSDHLISNISAFKDAVAKAKTAAMAGHLVTFGIEPGAPETGYGYIQRGSALAGTDGCFAVQRFVEKPDLATAQSYLADGNYAWNSGIFLFSASAYLDELTHHRPEMDRLCRAAVRERKQDYDFIRPDGAAFTAIKGDSIDYAVMERTSRAAIVPVDMGWNDVGSWTALWDIGTRDGAGNVTVGDVLLQDMANSYVRSDGPLVAAVGIEDAIIVATGDAVLVTRRDMAQKVKDIVGTLKQSGREESASHLRMFRPWGWYESISKGDGFQVKLIAVDPGAKISLQKHSRRAEHWVVVSGLAKVTRGQEILQLGPNESTYIPIGTIHRLENEGDGPLLIVETQTGGYLGEDDIERFDDQYGRG
jgi:mannose-1-phosphate guanylyltransferase/mannose-6-phosphate isomerase